MSEFSIDSKISIEFLVTRNTPFSIMDGYLLLQRSINLLRYLLSLHFFSNIGIGTLGWVFIKSIGIYFKDPYLA